MPGRRAVLESADPLRGVLILAPPAHTHTLWRKVQKGTLEEIVWSKPLIFQARKQNPRELKQFDPGLTTHA